MGDAAKGDSFTPEYFVLDVDGVLTAPWLLYNTEGKSFKLFGPDDHGALNLLRNRLKIIFITADKRGSEISRKRIVDEMKFDMHVVSEADRPRWFADNTVPERTIYMGDGIFDANVFRIVGYSICPANGFIRTREAADYVTHHAGGDRAVAEACLHVLERFFGVSALSDIPRFGVWGK